MTVPELISHLHKTYGFNWPKTHEVDAETYANVCQFIFSSTDRMVFITGNAMMNIFVGPDSGILFKNIELILKKS